MTIEIDGERAYGGGVAVIAKRDTGVPIAHRAGIDGQTLDRW